MHVVQGKDNELIVLYRDATKKRKQKVVKDFNPYFYVDEECKLDTKGMKIEHGFKSMFGDNLKKITVRSPIVVRELQKSLPKTFEADIKYTTRYLIDNPGIIKEDEFVRYLVIDIEVESLKEFPNPSEASHEIISISCYDNLSNKYFVLLQRSDLKKRKVSKNVNYNNKEHSYIAYYLSTEKDLLLLFGKLIKKISPDIILGWNSIQFDGQYLINRFKNLGLNLSNLSPVGGKVNCVVLGDKVIINIDGTTLIDAQEAYRKFQAFLSPWSLFGVESFSLNSVAERELGEGKSDTTNPTILWKEDIDKLEFYNYFDVFLTKTIIEKSKMISLLNELRVELKVTWDSVMYAGQYLDIFAIREINKLGYILPTKKKNEYESFEGAYTKEPEPGLFKNVIEFDMRSMYPSIILDCKISPENINDEGTIVIDDVKFLNRDGVMQHLVKGIYDKRMLVKIQMKVVEKKTGVRTEEWNHLYMKQTMYKIVINAMYGVFGYTKFRLFDVRIARSITFMGRYIIQYINSYLESDGYKSIYSDTDSAFIKVNDDLSTDDLNELSVNLNAKINKKLKELKEIFNLTEIKYLEVDLDKIYKSILFVEAKKKYMGIVVNSGGNNCYVLHLAGVAMKRRDTPKFAKELLKEIYMFVLEGHDKSEVESFIKSNFDKIVDKDVRDFGITVRIGKDLNAYKVNAQHIRAVKYSQTFLGKIFTRMDFVKILFIRRVPNAFPHTDVLALYENDTLPNGFEVDYERTLKRILEMKLRDIFRVIGWDFSFDYNLFRKQTTLKNYVESTKSSYS